MLELQTVTEPSVFRLFAQPGPLLVALAFCSFIPVLTAAILVFQIPTGRYPEESARLAIAPIAWFAHALAGAAFGISGPVQFVRALRHRFGRLHRVCGRVFVLSGVVLGFSGLSLLAQLTSERTPIADIARGIFGLALLIALAVATTAILQRNVQRHRAWMIRAYAIGMGFGTVSLVFFPIYLVTGTPPTGLAADMLFVGLWMLTIAFAEVLLRTSGFPIAEVSAQTSPRPARRARAPAAHRSGGISPLR